MDSSFFTNTIKWKSFICNTNPVSLSIIRLVDSSKNNQTPSPQ